MKAFEGFKSEASGKAYEQLPPGAYVATIKAVKIEGHEPDQTLILRLDIAEGEYEGYYTKRYMHDTKNEKTKYPAKYKGDFRIRIPNPDNKRAMYPESDLKRFNDAIYRIENSNAGYRWDWEENGLKGLTDQFGIQLPGGMDKMMEGFGNLLGPAGIAGLVAGVGEAIQQIRELADETAGMAAELVDLSEKTVAMPKNLRERHDVVAEASRVTETAEEMLKYKTRRRKLEKQYSFSLGDYCIQVPISGEEIVQEGKTLHHCVGGYAARHISGATTILFLRKKRTPGRSFLTIELYKEKEKIRIRQIHGYKNEAYCGRAIKEEERFAWFLKPWLEWVNAGSKRDRDGNPILKEIIKPEVKSA